MIVHASWGEPQSVDAILVCDIYPNKTIPLNALFGHEGALSVFKKSPLHYTHVLAWYCGLLNREIEVRCLLCRSS